MSKKFTKGFLLVLIVLVIYASYQFYIYLRSDPFLRYYLKHTVFLNLKDQIFDAKDIDEVRAQMPDSIQLPTLSISFHDSVGRALEADRLKRLKAPIYIQKNTNPWHAAQLEFKGQTHTIRLRLRGDTYDNYKYGLEHATMRLNLKAGKEVMGYRKFSLIRPFHESGFFGFFYYRFMEQQGFLSNDFHFVEVRINGKSAGIWVFQEAFTEQLYRTQNRKDGMILRFENDCMELNKQNKPSGFPKIDAYNLKAIIADTVRLEQFNYATDKLEQMRQQQLNPSLILDYSLWAKFVAISDIFYAHHAMECHNTRLYFNPETQKIEPIAWDPTAYKFLPYDHPETFFMHYRDRSPIYSFLVGDTTFLKMYLHELFKMVNSDEIIAMVNKYQGLVGSLQMHLNTPIVFARFDSRHLQHTQTELQNQFHIAHPLWTKGYKKEKRIEIINTSVFPIYCKEILWDQDTISIQQVIFDRWEVLVDTFPEKEFNLRYKLPNESDYRTEQGLVFEHKLP